MTRLMSSVHRAAATRAGRALMAGSVTGCVVLAVASCSGGAIAQDTPRSSGQGFVGASYSSTYYSPGSRPVAPKVTGTTLGGRAFSLAAERGSVIVINFWGSWCAPCRQEAPVLAALARRFSNEPVRFVGDDVHDYAAAARAFERTFNVGYPSLSDPGEQIVLAFHATVPPQAIPSTLVIDRSGHIAGRIFGEVSYVGLRALIGKTLSAQS